MAIAYVNSAGAIISDSAPGNTVAYATTVNLTAGNLSVVQVRWSGAVTITGIADDAPNTYVQSTSSPKVITGSDNLAVWYKENITAKTGATITITFSGAPGGGSIYATHAQYSGIATASALDTSINVAGAISGTPLTTGGFTTSQAEELIISAVAVSGGSGTTLTPTGTSGSYTKRTMSIIGGTDIAGIADIIVSSTQSGATASWSDSSADTAAIIVATFKAPAAGETITMDKWSNRSFELIARRLKGMVPSGTITIKT